MNSLNKSLDILEILAVNDKLQLGELSGLSRIKKSTANRILSALVKRGYVRQEHKRGRYSLNTSFVNISIEDRKAKKLREVAIPYLLKLGEILKENVVLTIRHEDSAYIIATAEYKNVLTTLVEIGSKIPLYCTAQGKIFLSQYSDKELEHYFKNVELTRDTPNTITDPKYLKASLQMIKVEGVAYEEEERILGMTNIATGVTDSVGQFIASVGIIGPSVRLTREKISEMLPELRRCASEISEALQRFL